MTEREKETDCPMIFLSLHMKWNLLQSEIHAGDKTFFGNLFTRSLCFSHSFSANMTHTHVEIKSHQMYQLHVILAHNGYTRHQQLPNIL